MAKNLREFREKFYSDLTHHEVIATGGGRVLQQVVHKDGQSFLVCGTPAHPTYFRVAPVPDFTGPEYLRIKQEILEPMT